MDLGLQGKTAIVCASSAGLGLGCALALAEEGVNLVLNGRAADRLAQADAQARAGGRQRRPHESVAARTFESTRLKVHRAQQQGPPPRRPTVARRR